jgi:hypothetical protein
LQPVRSSILAGGSAQCWHLVAAAARVACQSSAAMIAQDAALLGEAVDGGGQHGELGGHGLELRGQVIDRRLEDSDPRRHGFQGGR